MTASDAPSNPGGLALTGDKESAPFDVDNTPPTVTAVARGQERRDACRSRCPDDSSHRAQGRVLGGRRARGRRSTPPTASTTSAEETYEVALRDLAGPGPHVVVVRASDLLGNVATGRVGRPVAALNVLLVRAGALGDVLLLRRAVACLRRRGHRVALLAPRGPGAALIGSRRRARWTECCRGRPRRSPACSPRTALARCSARRVSPPFDAAIAYTPERRPRARPAAATVRRVLVHDPLPPPGGGHAAEWLARAGHARSGCRPRRHRRLLRAREPRSASRRGRPRARCHPASWPSTPAAARRARTGRRHGSPALVERSSAPSASCSSRARPTRRRRRLCALPRRRHAARGLPPARARRRARASRPSTSATTPASATSRRPGARRRWRSSAPPIPASGRRWGRASRVLRAASRRDAMDGGGPATRRRRAAASGLGDRRPDLHAADQPVDADRHRPARGTAPGSKRSRRSASRSGARQRGIAAEQRHRGDACRRAPPPSPGTACPPPSARGGSRGTVARARARRAHVGRREQRVALACPRAAAARPRPRTGARVRTLGSGPAARGRGRARRRAPPPARGRPAPGSAGSGAAPPRTDGRARARPGWRLSMSRRSKTRAAISPVAFEPRQVGQQVQRRR